MNDERQTNHEKGLLRQQQSFFFPFMIFLYMVYYIYNKCIIKCKIIIEKAVHYYELE